VVYLDFLHPMDEFHLHHSLRFLKVVDLQIDLEMGSSFPYRYYRYVKGLHYLFLSFAQVSS
jgi:hypothetical protein